MASKGSSTPNKSPGTPGAKSAKSPGTPKSAQQKYEDKTMTLLDEMILGQADLLSCYRAFVRFDRDNSGSIDFKELTALLRSMGQNPTDAEVHDMINEVDVDGSGVVEFEEFVQFIKRLMKNMDPENECREAFRRFDPTDEGMIRVPEFRFVMSNLPVKLTPAELDEIVSAADADNDGMITFQEFRNMMGMSKLNLASEY